MEKSDTGLNIENTSDNLFYGLVLPSARTGAVEDVPKVPRDGATSIKNELNLLVQKVDVLEATLRQVQASHATQLQVMELLQKADQELANDIVVLQRLKDAQTVPNDRSAADADLQRWRTKVDARFDVLESSKGACAVDPEKSFVERVNGSDSVPVQFAERLAHLEKGLVDVIKSLDVSMAEMREQVADSCNYPVSDESMPVPLDGKPTEVDVSTEEQAQEELDQHAQYFLEQSAWDAAAFAGSRAIGLGGTFLVILSLVLTLVIQATVSMIVWHRLVDDPASQELKDDLSAWRVRFGHDGQHFDTLTQTSLVTRVCATDGSLQMSFDQKSLVEDINMYLGSDGLIALPLGPMLCIVSLMIWLLYIIGEFRQTISWIWAFWTIDLADRTRVLSMSKDEAQIKTISVSRLRYVTMLGVARLSIAVLLCIAGTFFLVNEIDLADLIMNAVALTFVLEVDELLYSAILPRVVKILINKLKPIPASPARVLLFGADVPTLASLLGGTITIVAVKLLMLNDVTAGLRDVKAIMCGGRKNFIFALNAQDGAVNWASTRDAPKSTAPTTYPEFAVAEILEVFPSDSTTLSLVTNLQRALDLLKSEVGELVTNPYDACEDLLDAFSDGTLQFRSSQDVQKMYDAILESKILQKTEQSNQITSCRDVQEYCDVPSLPEVRSLCSVTCGCGSLTAGLYLSHSSFGCLRACRHVAYESLVTQQSCEDIPASVLRSDEGWRRYWDGFHLYRAYFDADSDRLEETGIARDISLEYGCAIAGAPKREAITSFCNPELGFAGRAFCPNSCGCSDIAEQQDACPSACALQNSAIELYRFNYSGKISCSNADLDLGSKIPICDIQVQGRTILQINDVYQACCDAAMVAAAASAASNLETIEPDLTTLCCLPGCASKFTANSAVKRILFEGAGISASTCRDL